MRVLLLSPFGTKVNPYIGLFGAGLQAAGAHVQDARVLTPEHLRSGARPDVIHLHWLERYNQPLPLQPSGRPGRLASIVRAGLRVLDEGPSYQLRRWSRLVRLFDLLNGFQREGGRLAYTVHNLDPHEAGGGPDRWALAAMIRRADLLHVHDQTTADAIARRYGRRTGMAVIPHGHYRAAYPNTVGRLEARAQLGLPIDAFVFVCLGLMRPYKGLEELLPAFRQMEGQTSHLVVAGRPPSAAYVERLQSLAGGDARIHLAPGFVPPEEIQVYLNAADVAVLPYRQITTSGAALLAFSFGLPVVAPAIGAFPNLVAPPRGILYQPGELLPAMEQARRLDWFGAREMIMTWVSQFDWEDIGRRLIAAYLPIADTP